jgi:hypothetical protein
MNDTKSALRQKNTDVEGETTQPARVVREGVIATSVWLRKSPAG